MGKHSGKKKKQVAEANSSDSNVKQTRDGHQTPAAYDKETAMVISMSQELKDEGNKLFQKRDYEGAMLKYEKAIKLLPQSHVDIAYLRSNIAACYMQMGIIEYPRAVHECNLALEITPRYTKALLKRARCYEALNQLDLALRDVNWVLSSEPNNLMAAEVLEKVKDKIKKKDLKGNDSNNVIISAPEFVKSPCAFPLPKVTKENKKKKSNRIEEKGPEDKVVVKEKINSVKEEGPKTTLKLIFGEDIRMAQIPANCTLLRLREVIRDRFPCSKAVLIKYRDQEGDLVTITNNEELKWAKAAADPQTSVRLYIVEVNPEQDPFYEIVKKGEEATQKPDSKHQNAIDNLKASTYVDNWIIRFAQLFKNHVGFDSDECLDFHELGMELYSEAMEETVTSDEAQKHFDTAAKSFQEMAALALFNWGNVHMSRARKQVYLAGDSSSESMLEQVKSAYDWAQNEYVKAGRSYEDVLRIKPDFYEGLLALGKQQFERARLSWYYAVGSNLDLETWASKEVLPLFNSAEGNMEKGMEMWNELEKQILNKLSKTNETSVQLEKMAIDGLFKNISAEEPIEQATNMRSQINLLWGTMLYERSVIEFKLEIPVWHECLAAAVEKFELAGASETDTAVIIKNHCSNENTAEGFGFKIDELVQAWNEMYEAKRWKIGIPSFRLEPLFLRRIPQLFSVLENP